MNVMKKLKMEPEEVALPDLHLPSSAYLAFDSSVGSQVSWIRISYYQRDRVGVFLFARILLGNRLHKYGIYSAICTTHEAGLRFRFSYLQFMGFYSKSR